MVWIDLLWSAPPECPTRDRIVSEVGDLIGDRAPTQKWRAEAVVEQHAADLWSLRLTTEVDGSNHPNVRELTASSCGELAHAAAVVLAVDVDPNSAPVTETPISKADLAPTNDSPLPDVRPARPTRISFPAAATPSADVGPASPDHRGLSVPRNTFAASARSRAWRASRCVFLDGFSFAGHQPRAHDHFGRNHERCRPRHSPRSRADDGSDLRRNLR